MIEIKLLPRNQLKTFYFFEYFDPIQKKIINHPVSLSSIDSMRSVIQRRLGHTDVKLITVYTEVEIE